LPNRLFYVWHESQLGEPRLELMIVRAKDMSEAFDKFKESMTEEYCDYLVTLQIKTCDSVYLD
jgi:hypothetical protein